MYKNKKLPNKIFFTGPKGIGKATMAYHLINYIFSSKEEYQYDLANINNDDVINILDIIIMVNIILFPDGIGEQQIMDSK